MLAGGRSSRMGTPKASLEWHGSTLLRRVTGIVARGVEGPVVVVSAPGQPLPELAPGVELAEDPVEGRGPLQGLAVGLGALEGRAEVAFLSSTDVPLLHPSFVARVIASMTDEVDVVLPIARGFPQPLAAAYRVSLRPMVEELLAEDRLKPAFLFDVCRVRRIRDEELLDGSRLARLDPALDSVLNLNEPADYEAAHARPLPAIRVQRFGALRRAAPDAPAEVHAATLGQAARAAGIELDEHVVAALNGDQISRDPELPLTTGDLIAFLAADAGG